MKRSPLQLKHLLFQKVFVDAAVTNMEDENEAEENEAIEFDFEGVSIDSNIDIKCQDEASIEPSCYVVHYAFRINNEEGKKCPYLIECIVSGLFEVVGKVPKEERETFVKVNGTTLLFGAIREQIASITSRSINGMLLLPTVNFLDLKKPKPEITGPAKSPGQ
jgi:preprotein translocase subunit SecB